MATRPTLRKSNPSAEGFPGRDISSGRTPICKCSLPNGGSTRVASAQSQITSERPKRRFFRNCTANLPLYPEQGAHSEGSEVETISFPAERFSTASQGRPGLLAQRRRGSRRTADWKPKVPPAMPTSVGAGKLPSGVQRCEISGADTRMRQPLIVVHLAHENGCRHSRAAAAGFV